MLAHLTIAGFAEAAFTGLAVAYLLRTHPACLPGAGARRCAPRLGKAGWAGALPLLAAMVVLTPLGLLAPGRRVRMGRRRGGVMVGYVPAGLGSTWTTSGG